MKRKIIGIAGALALALVGTVVLVAYVQSARDEIVASEAMVKVWVVKTTIAEGTPSADIEGAIEQTEVPDRVRAEGSVEDLDDLEGLVTSVELVAGEQLVASRFSSPTVARRGDVPADLLQMTIELDPQRALGGRVRAGDIVGVVLSFPDPETSHLQLHGVLVASVQIADNTGIPKLAGEGEDTNAVSSAPTVSLLVTLALDARSLEQVVFAAEFGTLWLVAEPIDAPEGGTRLVDRGNVYEGAAPR